ncbi:MAG: DRTGG domain-containing protein [Candidatus Neomarinimicrobiota bacterium]
MELDTIIKQLGLTAMTTVDNLAKQITGAYASDLLSDVLAHAKEGDLWITLQTHPNIIAVATMKSIAGIILVNGRQPESETLKKASEEKIPIFTTEGSTFELAGQLYKLLGEK